MQYKHIFSFIINIKINIIIISYSYIFVSEYYNEKYIQKSFHKSIKTK